VLEVVAVAEGNQAVKGAPLPPLVVPVPLEKTVCLSLELVEFQLQLESLRNHLFLVVLLQKLELLTRSLFLQVKLGTVQLQEITNK
jgi:hypothetical protein